MDAHRRWSYQESHVKKVPLINFLVHVPGKGVSLLDVVDCTAHMSEGGTKDALYVYFVN